MSTTQKNRSLAVFRSLGLLLGLGAAGAAGLAACNGGLLGGEGGEDMAQGGGDGDGGGGGPTDLRGFNRDAACAAVRAEATLAKLTAEVQKVLAQVAQIKAQATETNVGAAYSAMQAGGVAASSPGVAAAGDEILRSSGWQDATPQQPTPDPGGGGQIPPAKPPAPGAGRQVGMHQGIETPQFDGAPA